MFWKKKSKQTQANTKTIERVVRPDGGREPSDYFSAEPPALDIITEYADNKIYCRELRISLSHVDWCKFETQPFYHQLIEWVRSLENPEILRILDDLEREKNR